MVTNTKAQVTILVSCNAYRQPVADEFVSRLKAKIIGIDGFREALFALFAQSRYAFSPPFLQK